MMAEQACSVPAEVLTVTLVVIIKVSVVPVAVLHAVVKVEATDVQTAAKKGDEHDSHPSAAIYHRVRLGALASGCNYNGPAVAMNTGAA